MAALLLLLLASPAVAAPVTVDFESGAAPNEQVTSQYCCPGGETKGPTFMNASTEAGFNAGSTPASSGLICGPPHLDANDQAFSGTRTISLIGCAWRRVHGQRRFLQAQLADRLGRIPGRTGGRNTILLCPNFICAEIWTTAFRADRSIVMQQQTLLGPNTKFKGVPLLSGRG